MFILLYPSNTLVFTNGSFSFLTARYAYVTPELRIKSCDNPSPYVSSLMAEYIAILEALICIRSLTPDNYLLISDSQISLLAITENPSYSKCFPIILKIRSPFLSFNSKFFSIFFLWVSEHIHVLQIQKPFLWSDPLRTYFHPVPPSVSLF